MNAALRNLTDASELLDYPIAEADQLDNTFFIAFQHRRWLTSTTFLRSQPDVRGTFLTLMFQSFEQRPMGTLPTDQVELAALAGVEVTLFNSMCERDFGPLRGWVRCRCGTRIRLMHRVVLETIEERLSKREEARERAVRGNEVKRLNRLRDAVKEVGAGHTLQDPTMLDRLDAWLIANCPGNRTLGYVKEGLEAISMPP